MAKRVMVLALGVAAAITLGAAIAQLWLRWEQRSSAEPTDQNDPALTAEISEMEAYLADMVADQAEMEVYLADLQLRVSELRQQEAEALAAQQRRLEAVRAAQEQQTIAEIEAQLAEQAAMEQALQAAMEQARLRAAQATTTTLHPKVQAEGEALVAAVVERYEDSWPWVRAAWDIADLRFFDPKLPEPCEDSIACVLNNKEVWFTLDALRLEPNIWNSASYEDVVLHELGHGLGRLAGRSAMAADTSPVLRALRGLSQPRAIQRTAQSGTARRRARDSRQSQRRQRLSLQPRRVRLLQRRRLRRVPGGRVSTTAASASCDLSRLVQLRIRAGHRHQRAHWRPDDRSSPATESF